MVEFHLLWTLPAVVRIAQVLEAFDPFGTRIRLDSWVSLAEFARRSRGLARASERRAFRDHLEQPPSRWSLFDISGVRGLSKATRIIAVAEAYQLPITPKTARGRSS